MAKNGSASYWEITEGLQRARKSGPLGGSGGTNGEPVCIIRGSPSHITSHWSLRNWIRKRKQMHFGIQRESSSVAVISDSQNEPTNEQMIRYCSEWLHRQTEDQIRTECVFYHLNEPHSVFGHCTYITYRFSQTSKPPPYQTGRCSCQYSPKALIASKLRGAVQKNLCKKLRSLFFLLLTNCGRRNLDKAPRLTTRELFGFWLLIPHLSSQPIYLQILRWQCCLAEPHPHCQKAQ